MGLIRMDCPKCGATLEIKRHGDSSHYFCNYCGAKLLFKDDNEYTIHIVDEARLKEIDADTDEKSGSRDFFKNRIKYYAIGAAVGYGSGLALGLENKLGIGLFVIGGISLICLMYGSIIHGILLMRNKRKR